MGLWSWLTGIDLEAEEKRGAELDAIIAQQNRAAVQRGIWTGEQAEMAEDHWQLMTGQTSDVVGQVSDEFLVGAEEGFYATAGGISKGLNSVAGAAGGFVWRAVPWWVWLAGLGWVAWQLGWGRVLLGRITAR